jgi:hypothetical protein
MSFRRRCTPRVAVVVLIIWLILALLIHFKEELWDALGEGDAFNDADLGLDDLGGDKGIARLKPVARRTAVVVASQKSENATWLETYFPDWEKNIYAVDDQTAPLTVPTNKGRESMVYLR